MSIELITALLFGSMLALLLTGRQIVAIIAGVATISALLLWGTGAEQMPFMSGYSFMNYYPLIALPPFIFMGTLLSKSGVAEKLFEALYIWTGRIKGGLAMADVGLSCLVSMMSGTTVASTVTSTAISLPHMLKNKYDKLITMGTVLAGGGLGFLIPPSGVFILYGVIARVSIGHLWIAGVLPGFLLASMYVAYIGLRCHFQPQLGPPLPAERQVTLREKLLALRAGIAPLIIISLVLGLLFLGVTTILEASAIGAVGAMVAAAINRRLTWQVIRETMDTTLKTTSMFLWIVIAAFFFGAVFDGIGAIHAVENMLTLGGGAWATLILMQLSFFALGTVMDDTAMLLIVAPLYIPLVTKLGFSLVWYGVLYVLNCQMAMITPPFGYNLFLMKGLLPSVVPDSRISMGDIYRSVIPFVAVQGTCLAVVMAFPKIAMWLPSVVFRS